jgi:uncharacterized membrane protein
MKEKLSREAWTIIGLIVLVNFVSIVLSGFLSHAVPPSIRVFSLCILFVAAVFVVLEVRRQVRRKQILRRNKINGTI